MQGRRSGDSTRNTARSRWVKPDNLLPNEGTYIAGLLYLKLCICSINKRPARTPKKQGETEIKATTTSENQP